MPTDTSEKSLEVLIVEHLTTHGGYELGHAAGFDPVYALDLPNLLRFLEITQPTTFAQLALGESGTKRNQFFARVQSEITKEGVVHVLRKGVHHGPAHVDLFYAAPSQSNPKAALLFSQNIFSITRQLHFSKDEPRLSLDLCIFLNGLPLLTFELKNSLTRQTAADAIEQYKRDREPRELLFQFGRCAAHFAVDDQEVWFCTELKKDASWFLPFNRGWKDGAGNPPNPHGLKTDYLWREILARESLTDIIENYAGMIEEKDAKTGRKEQKNIFPRYHQLDVVRKLLEDARYRGAGQKYLIQHSAGSGKSNSIAWLALQLVGLEKDSKQIFDTAIVVTDRTVLDDQIAGTIRGFAQVGSVLGHANDSGDLRSFITEGKKIVITTVQMFPFILEKIGSDHRNRTFAILIDEAHSSQGGETAAKMNRALSADGAASDDETYEDQINRVMESRKMLANASYFAFTATPKAKTLELFGTPYEVGGKVKREAFHKYTMKQAIQEGFILDVLGNYTPIACYFSLIKTVEDDPEFDIKKANKKLRRYVESADRSIRTKAEIMVDHFERHVAQKIGGQARAMVVTSSIERALQYWEAFNAYLRERHSRWKAIVAFSGEPEFHGKQVTEASLNGFSSNKIKDEIQKDPYRFLICADKFQTGYDEPLLHTMYVDKVLSGIKAVQTLSRLNRSRPNKNETFVLDFQNDIDIIQKSFADYYRTTILSGETDPNKLHDLKADLDRHQVYSQTQIDALVSGYLADVSSKNRPSLDAILDACVAVYLTTLDEDGQVDFKGKAKAFVRTYGFLASILPYSVAAWEKLSIFLNFLIPKLPSPPEDDLSAGILKALDMESYRAEARETMKIALADEDAEIEPAPTSGGGRKPEPELERLSQIIRSFNERFGNFPGKTAEETRKVITEEIVPKVDADQKYKNARQNSDKQNSRIEMESALQRAIFSMMSDQTELFKKYADDPGFKSGLAELIFALTYGKPVGGSLHT